MLLRRCLQDLVGQLNGIAVFVHSLRLSVSVIVNKQKKTSD